VGIASGVRYRRRVATRRWLGGGQDGRPSTDAGTRTAPGWEVGDRVLGLYEVTGVLGEGGMGLVYRVRHLSWDTELAVKSPRAELFRDEADRRRFTMEAETWVGLGLHPHVCTCHYVRSVDGVPRVFAECLAGGSLRDWIDDGRLYEGGPSAALARIVDLAVQIAWGLEHAHAHGIVHQDVKPANVLLDRHGLAKVTDFGLARAREAGGPSSAAPAGDSILVSVGGMTPAYASPEQAAGEAVGRRSDVWSFAVSVLEMFTGGVSWMAGPAAGAALADHVRSGPHGGPVPPIPPALAGLLARCLRDVPRERPATMAEVAAELTAIYAREAGRPYPRERPRAAELRAAELNNRALSLLDLGRPDAAEEAFGQALEGDPRHLEATYNRGLLRWRAGRLTDDLLVADLEAIHRLRPTDGSRLLLARVHLERGDAVKGAGLLRQDDPQAAPDRESRAAFEVRAALESVADAAGDRAVALEHPEPAPHGETACLSRDGRLAVIATHNQGATSGEVRLWEPRSPAPRVRTLRGHQGRVNAVDLSADGDLALTGADDRTLRLWDTASGRQLQVVEAAEPGWTVNAVALGAGGTLAAIGVRRVDGSNRRHSEHRVELWDVRAGRRVREFGVVRSSQIGLSEDGRVVAAGIRLWDARTGQDLATLQDHRRAIDSLRLSPDGRHVLTASERTVRLCEAGTGRCVRTLHGHTSAVKSVALSADTRYALSGGLDHTVRLWDLETGRCLRTWTLTDSRHGPGCVALSGDARHALAMGGPGDHVTAFWRVQPRRPAPYQPCRPRAHAELDEDRIRVASLLKTGEEALAAGRVADAYTLLRQARDVPSYERAPETLAAWNRLGARAQRTGLRGAWPVRAFEGHTGEVTSASMTPDGRFALSVGRDATARLWDVATGRCLRTHPIPSGIEKVLLGADGRLALLTGHANHPPGAEVQIWDAGTGDTVGILRPDAGAVLGMCLSPDGRRALTCEAGGTARLWDVGTGRCLHVLRGHTEVRHEFLPGLAATSNLVYAVAASPDWTMALTGAEDLTVRLWDLAGGRCVRVLEGHRSIPRAVRFTSDGRYAVTGAMDRTIRVWELDTGRCVQMIKDEPNEIYSLALTADDRFAVSCGLYALTVDGRPRQQTGAVWDLHSGRCLGTIGTAEHLQEVSMAADGRYVLPSGGHDLRLWELDWDYTID
jgi:WD40 repeat protein/serine/threonine protein kinase